MAAWTRERMEAAIRGRDSCSGGRAEGCVTCGLRHSCNLDDAAEIAAVALRGMAALQETVNAHSDARRAGPGSTAESRLDRVVLTDRAILREVEWLDADD